MPRFLLAPLWFALGLASAQAQVLDLGFHQLFAQPIGPRGVEPSATLRQAIGQQVRLTGFMVQRERSLPGQFLLTPRPLAMSEHADGDADDLPAHTVTVLLPQAQRERRVAHHSGPITLIGRLEWGAAEIEPGRVSWLRLHLDSDALAPFASRVPLPHQH